MAAVLALLSSLLWGAADFFGGLATKSRSALLVVAVSQAAAAVVLGVIVLATGAWNAPIGYLPWALVWGITGPLGLAAFYHALSIGTMGVVSPISAMGIVLPVVVGFAIGDRVDPVQVAAIAVAIVGVILVGGPDVHTDDEASRDHGWRPIFFAVVAALSFGCSYVFNSQGAKSSVLMTLFTQRTMSATVAAVLVAAVVGWTRVGARDAIAMSGIGFGDVGANALYGWSSTLGLLSVTAVFGSLFPIVTMLLAWWLLHERLSRLQKVGVVLAMVGVVTLAAAGSA